jgi:hypothetical protein
MKTRDTVHSWFLADFSATHPFWSALRVTLAGISLSLFTVYLYGGTVCVYCTYVKYYLQYSRGKMCHASFGGLDEMDVSKKVPGGVGRRRRAW